MTSLHTFARPLTVVTALLLTACPADPHSPSPTADADAALVDTQADGTVIPDTEADGDAIGTSDADASTPDADGVGTPDGDASPPDADASGTPDADASLPDADASAPDADAGLPDADASMPDADANEPDADASLPDADASLPDADVSGTPDADASLPDADASLPDADASPPDAATDVTTPDNPPQNSVAFTYSTTCTIPEAPQTAGFEQQWINGPGGTYLDMTHAADGSNRIFLAEREGTVFVMEGGSTNPASAAILSLPGVDTSVEGGFLGLTMDPDFSTNGYMYVSYTTSVGGQFRNVIARYTFPDPSQDAVDPTSALILLEIDQPWQNHNGGDIQFGLDGYLYIAIGDGGVQGDPAVNDAQELDSLLGKVLRIDVHNPDTGLNYGIPADNPFVGLGGGVREEIFAYGFRNPWRMTVDRLTGDIWVGDVGEGLMEEVDIVTSGANYGWPWWEGTSCFTNTNGCSTVGFTMPVAEYTHDHGVSITGGYVYRGSEIPSLYGAYIYSEAWNGNYWTYRHGLESFKPEPEGIIGGAYSYGEDEAGELYMLNWGINKLVPTSGGPTVDFPDTLTETGCFADVAGLVPGEGLVPYEPRTPLWSDHVKKKRWVSLPPGGQITYDSTGKWVFPVGTVFVKHFDADVMDNGSMTTKRLETRLIVQDADGVRGYTYRWNAAQTEAFLLPGAETETLDIVPPNGSPTTMTWSYPSQSQCLGCHTDASGGVLGLETAQLNWATPNVDYPEMGAVNQVAAFGAYGLFDATLPADLAAEPLLTPVTATSAPVEDRVRSYLHSNCANCHMPGGPGGLPMDFRYTATFQEMNVCGELPVRGDLGIDGAELLKPGVPAESIIHARMSSVGPHRMPPLGTTIIDNAAVGAVEDWINGVQACP